MIITDQEIEDLARSVAINGEIAKPSDDGIDTWYGHQYLPSGALKALVLAARASGTCKTCKHWIKNNYHGPESDGTRGYPGCLAVETIASQSSSGIGDYLPDFYPGPDFGCVHHEKSS